MSPQWRDPVFLSPENQLPVFSGAGGALGQGQGVGGVTRVSLLLRQTFGQSYVFSPSVAPAARCRFLARGFKSANQVGFQLSPLDFLVLTLSVTIYPSAFQLPAASHSFCSCALIPLKNPLTTVLMGFREESHAFHPSSFIRRPHHHCSENLGYHFAWTWGLF